MNKRRKIQIRFRGNDYALMPQLKTTLVLLTLFLLLVYLGFWQLHRAKLKESWLEQFEQQQFSGNADLNVWIASSNQQAILQLNDTYPFHRFQVTGAFAPYYFLLDNQIFNGKIGFRVIQYFKLVDTHQYLLIDRGWVAQHRQRNDWPQVETPKGLLVLQVMAYKVSSGVVLKDLPFEEGWPKLIQKIDLPKIMLNGLPQTLPCVLLLQENQPGILKYVPPKLPMLPAKHLGYALQWFTMALALLIYFILISLKRMNEDEQPTF